jgi:hypothetical protein
MISIAYAIFHYPYSFTSFCYVQPLQLFLRLDAMTNYTCKTPKVGKDRKDKEEQSFQFENRVVGVEVTTTGLRSWYSLQ